MAAVNYTPISLYYSSTATNIPSAGNLVLGELAINIADGKLYYKNPSNVVTLLAVAGGAITPITNNGVVYINGSGQAVSGSALTFDGTNAQIGATGALRFADTDSSNYVAFKSPGVVSSNVTWTLPSIDGTTGQLLSTNGSGTLSWATPAAANPGGSTTQVQFNNAGAFGGSANLTFDGTSLTVNTVKIGLGAGSVAQNTVVGLAALAGSNTGAQLTALGYGTLNVNTSGAFNTAVGHSALVGNTTGSLSTAVGASALAGNTTGSSNTAVGRTCLTTNTTGSLNTAMGDGALALNTTGINNTAVGYQAGYTNTTGAENTAVGLQALFANTTGTGNTAFGYLALAGVTTGGGNIGLGYGAGYAGTFITNGTYNLCIGLNASVSGASDNNEIVIATNSGSNVAGKGSSTGFITPAGGGVYQGNNSSTWSQTSDQRLKKNIVDNTDGLVKIEGIRIRNFEYRLPEEVDAELKPTDAIKKPGVQLGVIAQELQQVLPDCVKQESTGVLSVDSDNLTWYLINAVKELSAEVNSLKSQLNGVQP